MAAKPIPDGYSGAIPYLSINGANQAIDFYKRAFGATEVMRIDAPAGRIGHAEIRIEGAMIMLADEFPEMNFKSPKSLGGTPVMIHVYVNNVDALAKQAADAGATITRGVSNQFYGDRTFGCEDPFGHSWYFATHAEDISPQEMQQRSEEWAKSQHTA